MKKMENKQIKHKNQKKGLHNEKGAITLFVLTSLLLFIATITAVYTFMQGKSSAVNEEIKQIKSKYEISDEQLNSIYDAYLNFKPSITLNTRSVSESGNTIKEIYGTIDLYKNDSRLENINVKTIKYGWLYYGTQKQISDLNCNTIDEWCYLEKQIVTNTERKNN